MARVVLTLLKLELVLFDSILETEFTTVWELVDSVEALGDDKLVDDFEELLLELELILVPEERDEEAVVGFVAECRLVEEIRVNLLVELNGLDDTDVLVDDEVCFDKVEWLEVEEGFLVDFEDDEDNLKVDKVLELDSRDS